MTTTTRKQTLLRGCNCTIELKAEANGFDYEVSQKMPRGTMILFCCGWAAGTRSEAMDEARDHAETTLKRIQDDTM